MGVCKDCRGCVRTAGGGARTVGIRGDGGAEVEKK